MDRPQTRYLTPTNCRFTLTDTDMLRAVIDDQFTCMRVSLRRLFPIRNPSRFIAVREDGGDEVGIIEDIAAFDHSTRHILEKELDYYYSLPVITEILFIGDEFGFIHWEVETSRGPHDFHVKGRADSITRISDNELYVTDIHNCRYHIPDINELSPASQKQLKRVL